MAEASSGVEERTPDHTSPGRVAAPASPDLDEQRRAEKAAALLMSVRMALRKGNRDAARRQLQQALALAPHDAAALELVGDIFMEEAEQEKALQVFEKGLALHPGHAQFQEKIALCHIDLAEMQRDAEARRQLMELGDRDAWLDRKPWVALGLSAVVPGIGQFYNEEDERGAIFLVAMLGTFCGWFLPLSSSVHAVQAAGGHNLIGMLQQAVDRLTGLNRLWFSAMMLAWNAIYFVAALDGWQGAQRANLARRRSMGMN